MQFNLLISNTYLNAFENVLSKIKQNYLNSNYSNILIVPDRFTLNAEKSIFESLNIESTFNIKVLTLSHLSNLVIGSNIINKNLLSKQSGIMLITKLILKNKDKLKAFSKSAKLVGFAEELFETINQLKSCNITPEQFINSYEGNNTALKLKIHDIALVYKEYESYLQNTYIDASSKLNLLIENLHTCDLVKESNIYFALFDSFTPQQYLLIQKLVKESKSVTVGFVSNTKQNNKNIYLDKMYNSLTAIAKSYGMNLKDVIINSSEVLNNELNFVANNMYALTKKSVELKNNNIQLFEAANIVEEVEFIASKIKIDIINNNYRYKDINIAVANTDTYSRVIKEVFNKCDIPYFIDESKNLTEHIYVKFILQALALVKKYFNSNDVINYTKNLFAQVNFKNQNIFEDFVLKFGIDGSSFFEKFKLSNQTENSEIYESVRQKIMPILISFQKALFDCKTGAEFVNKLKDFLKTLNVKESLLYLENEYEKSGNIIEQKITSQVYDKVNKLLEEFEHMLGETELNLSEFYNIFENGLKAINISTIPVNVDSVFVGNANSNNFLKSKSLFVLGCVEGDVPVSKQDCGIILDEDIKNISEKEKIEPSIRELNLKSRFNFFQLLLTANKKLHLSYPILGIDGKENKPSIAMLEIQKLFHSYVNNSKVPLPFYTMEDYLNSRYASELNKAKAYSFYYINKNVALDKVIKEMRDFEDGNTPYNLKATSSAYRFLEKEYGHEHLNDFVKMFKYENKIENINNAASLFFNKERTKISQLESYFSCPFKHYMDYGLKVKEKERAGIKAIDVGTILHAVAEKFGLKLKEQPALKWDNLKNTAEQIIDSILKQEKYYFITKNKNNENIIKSLKAEAQRVIQAIYYQNSNSKFEMKELEYKFGLNNNKTELKLELDGKTLNIGGIIDRIDFLDNYFRVIDYKTGKSEFKFKDLYLGKKIQLFIYSSVVKALTGKNPAGTFYFPIKNEFEEFKKQSGKFSLYKLEGPYLNDLKIIKAIDKSLSLKAPKSQIINVTLKTTKKLVENNIFEIDSHSTKRSLTNKQFSAMQNYALKVSQKAGNEILEGYINASPSSENGGFSVCDYCKYNSVCKFSEDFNNAKRLLNHSITKKQIEEVIENE